MNEFLGINMEDLRKELGVTGEADTSPVIPNLTMSNEASPTFTDEVSVAGFNVVTPSVKEEEEELKPSLLGFNMNALKQELGISTPKGPSLTFAPEPTADAAIEFENYIKDKNREKFDIIATEQFTKNKKALESYRQIGGLAFDISEEFAVNNTDANLLSSLPDQLKPMWELSKAITGGKSRKLIATTEGVQDIATVIFEGLTSPAETQEGKKSFWYRVLSEPETRAYFLQHIPDKGPNKELLNNIFDQYDNLKLNKGVTNSDFNETLYSALLQAFSNLPQLARLGGAAIPALPAFVIGAGGALGISTAVNNTIIDAQSTASSILADYLNGNITKAQYEGVLKTSIKPEFLNPETGEPLTDKIQKTISDAKGGLAISYGHTTEELESLYKYSGPIFEKTFKSMLTGEKLAAPEYGIVYNKESLKGDFAAELLTSMAAMLVTRSRFPGTPLINLLNVGTSSLVMNMTGNVLIGKSLEQVMSTDAARDILTEIPTVLRPVAMQALNIVPSVVAKFGYRDFMAPVIESYGNMLADAKLYAVSNFFKDMSENLKAEDVFKSIPEELKVSPVSFTAFELKPNVQVPTWFSRKFTVADNSFTLEDILPMLNPTKVKYRVEFNTEGAGALKVDLPTIGTKLEPAGESRITLTGTQYAELIRTVFKNSEEILDFTSKIEKIESNFRDIKKSAHELKKLGLTKEEAESLKSNSDLTVLQLLDVNKDLLEDLRIGHKLTPELRTKQIFNITHHLLAKYLMSNPAIQDFTNTPASYKLSNLLGILDGMANRWLTDSNSELVARLSSRTGNSALKDFLQTIMSLTLTTLRNKEIKKDFGITSDLLKTLSKIKTEIKHNPKDTLILMNKFLNTLRAGIPIEARQKLSIDPALGEDFLTYLALHLGAVGPASINLAHTHKLFKEGKATTTIMTPDRISTILQNMIDGGVASVYKLAKQANLGLNSFASLQTIRPSYWIVSKAASAFKAQSYEDFVKNLQTNLNAIFKLYDIDTAVKDLATINNSVGCSNESQRTLQILGATHNALKNGKKASLHDRFTAVFTPILDSGLLSTLEDKVNALSTFVSENDVIYLRNLLKSNDMKILSRLGFNRSEIGMIFATYGLDSKNLQIFRNAVHNANNVKKSVFGKYFLAETSEQIRGSEDKITVLESIFRKATDKNVDYNSRLSEKAELGRKELIKDALTLIGLEETSMYRDTDKLAAADSFTLIEEFTSVFKQIAADLLEQANTGTRNLSMNLRDANGKFDYTKSPFLQYASLKQLLEFFKMKMVFAGLADNIKASILKEISLADKSSTNEHYTKLRKLADAYGIEEEIVNKIITGKRAAQPYVERFINKIIDSVASSLISEEFEKIGLNLSNDEKGIDGTMRILQNNYITLDGTRLIGQLTLVNGIAKQIELGLHKILTQNMISERVKSVSELKYLLENYKDAVNVLLDNADLHKFGEKQLAVMRQGLEWSVNQLSKNVNELLTYIEKDPNFPTDSTAFKKYISSMISVFDVSSKIANSFFENLAENTKRNNFNYTPADIEAAFYSSMQAISKMSLYTVKKGLTEIQAMLPSQGPIKDAINFAKRQYYTLLTKESFGNFFRYTFDPFFGFSEAFKEIQRVIKLDNETMMSNLKLAWAKMFHPDRIKKATAQLIKFVEYLADNYGKNEAETLLYKALYWKFSPKYIEVEDVDQQVLSAKVKEYMGLFKAAKDTGLLPVYIEQAMKFFASADDYNIDLKDRQALDAKCKTALETYAKKNGLSYAAFESKLKANGQSVDDVVDITGLLAKDVVGDILFGAVTDDTVFNALLKHAPILADIAYDIRKISRQITNYALKENLVGIDEVERNPYAGLRKLYLSAAENNANSFIKNPINALKILTDTRYYSKVWQKDFLRSITSDILDTDFIEKIAYENPDIASVRFEGVPTALLKQAGQQGRIIFELKNETDLIRFAMFGEGRPNNDRGLVDHIIQIIKPPLKKGEKAKNAKVSIGFKYDPSSKMITLQNAVLYASRTDADDKLPKAGVIIRNASNEKSGRVIKGKHSEYAGVEFGVTGAKDLKNSKIIELTEEELLNWIANAKDNEYGKISTKEVIAKTPISNIGGSYGQASEKALVKALQDAMKQSTVIQNVKIQVGDSTVVDQTVNLKDTTEVSKILNLVADTVKQSKELAAIKLTLGDETSQVGSLRTLKALLSPKRQTQAVSINLGKNQIIRNVIEVGTWDNIKAALEKIPAGQLDASQAYLHAIKDKKSLKPDVWLLSKTNNKYKFTFLSVKDDNAGFWDSTSTLLKEIPILQAFIDLSATKLKTLLETLSTVPKDKLDTYMTMIGYENTPAYTTLVGRLESAFKSAPFIVKIVSAYLSKTNPEFADNPFKTVNFNEMASKFIKEITRNKPELYNAILQYRQQSSKGEDVDFKEALVDDITNVLYETIPWFKKFEDLIEKNHDVFVKEVPNMMEWMYGEEAGGKTDSEALFTQRLINIANGVSRGMDTQGDDKPFLQAQEFRARSILGDIRKLDPSYLAFSQMASNPFTVLNKAIGELMTQVKANRFIGEVLSKSGMMVVFPSNSKQLQFYENNPEYKVMSVDDLKKATHNEIFGQSLLQYIRYMPEFAIEAERFALRNLEGPDKVAKPTKEGLEAYTKAMAYEKSLFSKTKVAIHTSLLSELKNLYEEVEKKNLLHRFLNNLMADYRYEYNGAVLTLNHIGWIRNFIGAAVLPMYALGPTQGIYYAIKAMRIMRGYAGNEGATELANFKLQNRTVPMANARFSAEPFANMHSIKQEELSKMYKIASMALVKPLQIGNKIASKSLQTVLNTNMTKGALRSLGVDTSDPFMMMAGLRNLYGAVDEISKFAVFLAAKEGKIKAPTATTWINNKFKQAGNDAFTEFSNLYGANQFRKDIGDGTLGKMSNEDAFKFARQFSFTYEQLPKFFQGLRTYYNPFISFVYNSGRILGNAMKMYPFRTIATYVALKEMNNIMQHQYGISLNFNTIIPGMDMLDAFSAGTFPDSMNPTNPTAPLSKLAYIVWNNRDPFTKQELPEAGLLGRLARGYTNSIFTMSPTLNYALRHINHALPYDASFVEQSKIASYLEGLLPKSYIYTKLVEQGLEGKPIDRFRTKISPWVGMLYAIAGLNIDVVDQIKYQRQVESYARILKSETTKYHNLLKTDPYKTNKDVVMELQKSEAKIKRIKKQFGEAAYKAYGYIPYVASDEYNPLMDGNIIENVLNYTVNELLNKLVPGLFSKSYPIKSVGRVY